MAMDKDGHDSIELEHLSLSFDGANDHARRRSVSSMSDDNFDNAAEESEKELYSAVEERAVIRKLDRRLVVFVAFLYMLSFLDRSNIGNARIAGLTEDLNLSSSQYEWLLTSFYITYILFQWMTLLYRVVPAHIYVSLCVASWSLIAGLQSVVSSFWVMLILRAALGIGEAAFSPGIPFLLSFFFKREELAFRTGLFISAAPLATSFASSLAWLITKAGQHIPIAAWRLLFLVEGSPSIIAAVVAWYQIPDSPSSARFLTGREKRIAALRLSVKTGEKKASLQEEEPKPKLNWREIRQALTDPKCYLTALMFFSCNVAFSSLPPFLPTIIHEMSFSPLTSQALSFPPYLFSFAIVLLTAFLSDRARSRSSFVIFHALLGAGGYLWIALAGYLRAGSLWRYLGVYPAAAGFFSAITIIITWTINNQDSDSKRGTGVAMLNILGQFGPLVGTRLYPDSDKPYYVRGMSVCGGFMFFVAVLAWFLRRWLMRENDEGGGGVGYRVVGEEDRADGEGVVAGGRRFVNIL